MLDDLRHAVRGLRRSPGFTSAAILVLALPLAANSSVYQGLYRGLIQPLPYPDPASLMLVWQANPRSEWSQLPVSFPNYDDLRRENDVFTDLAAWHSAAGLTMTLTGPPVPRTVRYALASANLFPTLGVTPQPGRGFRPEEDRPNGPRLAVVSRSFWREALGADPGVIGRQLVLDGEPYQITGVLPAGFRFVNHPAEPDVWLPLALDPAGRGRMFARPVKYLGVVGRLRSGVDPERAAADLAAIGRRLEVEYPGTNSGWRFELQSLRDQLTRPIRPALLLLQAAVALVLLIACANLAALLLARGHARRRDLAVRAALGVPRWALVRLVLMETGVIAAAGGGLGLLASAWSGGLVSALLPAPETPLAFQALRPGADLRLPIVGFTLGLAGLTTLVAGLLPALRVSRFSLTDALRAGAGDHDAGRLQGALVVLELALSLMLLIGAGLLLRSFDRLRRVDPGFRAPGVLAAELNLRRGRYDDPEAMRQFHDALSDQLAAIPGVAAVGAVEQLPLSGQDQTTDIRVAGEPAPSPGQERSLHYRSADPGYLPAMGIRLLAGRNLTVTDRAGAPRVALINASAARLLWPGQDPLGKRVALSVEALVFDGRGPPRLDFEQAYRTVVGVVEDVHHSALALGPRAEMYVPYAQRPTRDLGFVLRTPGDPGRLAPAFRQALAEIDSDQPLGEVTSMQTRVSESIAQPLVRAQLVGGFALLAAALAAIGVYGVLSYLVRQRTRELGVRLALGATGSQLTTGLLRRGARLLLPGVLLGLLGAWAGARLLGGLLYGVAPDDPVTFVLVPLLLGGVGLLACWLPARRAARVDPIIALRED